MNDTTQWTEPDRTYGRRWRLTWEGLEGERDRVHEIAREVAASDAALRALCNGPSSLATGLVCALIRDPRADTGAPADVAEAARRAADAQNALRGLHARLVWECGMDWCAVRDEWAPLLCQAAQ
jgi:hypothetical protein